MNQLIVCRFVQGLGLGAEIVVGYSTLTEFVPPKTRGRWLAFMAFLVVAGFPATAILGYLIIPTWGWRPMFIIAGIGSLIVWYLRKNLAGIAALARIAGPHRGGRSADADRSKRKSPAPARCRRWWCRLRCRRSPPPPCSSRRSCSACWSGSWVLITINTLIFGFVIFLPQFFLRQGLTITNSLGYTRRACQRIVGRLRFRRHICPTTSDGAGASSARRFVTIAAG